MYSDIKKLTFEQWRIIMKKKLEHNIKKYNSEQKQKQEQKNKKRKRDDNS
jgi:hypothetical protein